MDAAPSVANFGVQISVVRIWLSRKATIGQQRYTGLRCGGCLDIATVVWATIFI